MHSASRWVTFGGCVLVVAVLHWGQTVLVPVALAMLVSFVLTPPVSWLQRRLGRLTRRGQHRRGCPGRAANGLPLFETSLPRVFAVGDVRGGSVKHAAAAVGEGSVGEQLVHGVLAEQRPRTSRCRRQRRAVP